MTQITMLLACAAILTLVRCSAKDCYDDIVDPTYRISVVDGATSESICDANVTVNGSAAVRSEATCTYAHPIPGGSMATVGATKVGYQPVSLQVPTSFLKDECGKPKAKSVNVVMQPE